MKRKHSATRVEAMAIAAVMRRQGIDDLCTFAEASKHAFTCVLKLLQFADGVNDCNPTARQQDYHDALDAAHKAINATRAQGARA